jgi:hypothetical protein
MGPLPFPPANATNFDPSAEEAIDDQNAVGALVCRCQIWASTESTAPHKPHSSIKSNEVLCIVCDCFVMSACCVLLRIYREHLPNMFS